MFDQPGQSLLFVMIGELLEGFFDFEMLQQLAAIERVFSDYEITLLQRFERAQSDIRQVSNWRSNYI